MTRIPLKAERDVRRAVLAIDADERHGHMVDHWGGYECDADREPAAREARIRELIRRIRPVLGQLTGTQRCASDEAKAAMSRRQKARRAQSATGLQITFDVDSTAVQTAPATGERSCS